MRCNGSTGPAGRTTRRSRAWLTALGIALASWTGSNATQVTTVGLCEQQTATSGTCDGADVKLEGDQAADGNIGFSIAMGYLDGDRFSDLVVAAPNSATVYVFYGGLDRGGPPQDLDARGVNIDQADLTLTLSGSSSQFGFSVAIAPKSGPADFSGALIVGAPAGGSDTPGRAFVVPGSYFAAPTRPTGTVDILTASSLRLTGQANGDRAGYSVEAGPVLQAGADDFLVGAPEANAGTGVVYAVPATLTGDVNLGDPAVRKIVGAEYPLADDATVTAGERLGEFLATDDFANNGGTYEVAIGAVGSASDDSNTPGRVYVLDVAGAGADLDLVNYQGRRIDGLDTNDFFGFSLASGAIVAGVGPDLAVGAIYVDRTTVDCATDETNAGAIYVFDGTTLQGILAGPPNGPAMTADVAARTFWGYRKWDELGFSLDTGDVNGDGETDLVAAARRHDRNQQSFDQIDEGAVYVFYGPVNGADTCLDCTNNCDPGGLPMDVDVMLFGGKFDLGTGTSEEVGYSLAVGEFNTSGQLADPADPANRTLADIAVSSIAHERVYLVSVESTDAANGNPDGQVTDTYRDIRDRDDDGDGYDDTIEDFNGDGILGTMFESDPLVPNRDVTVEILQVGPSATIELACTDSVQITVRVTNSGAALSLADPMLQVVLPDVTQPDPTRPIYTYVQGSTMIGGVPVTDGGVFPFINYRTLNPTGTGPLQTPLASGDSIDVVFELQANLPLAYEIPTALDDFVARVQLGAADPNELPYPHDGGISQRNDFTRSINLLWPRLAGSVQTPRAPSKQSIDRDAGLYLDPLDVLDYIVYVRNIGTYQATNFNLSDMIQMYTTYDTGSLVSNWGTPDDRDPTNLKVMFGDLPVGQSATVRFSVTVDENAPQNLLIENQGVFSEACLAADLVTDSFAEGDNDAAEGGNNRGDVTDDDKTKNTVTVISTGSISKTPGVPSIDEPGAPVEFTVVVNDTGNVRLTLETLTDTDYGDLTNPANPLLMATTCNNLPQDIAVGGMYTCIFTAMVTGNFGDPPHMNTVNGTGTVPNGDPATITGGTAMVAIDAVAAVPLSVMKSVMPMSLPEPGGLFSYTVVITNGSGADTATVTAITDSLAGAVTSCLDAGMNPITPPFDLVPGAAATCTFSANHNGNAGDTFTNTVTVTAVDDDGDNVGNNSNMIMVDLTDVAAVDLTVLKTTTTPSLPEPGGNFAFNVLITNPSTVDTATVTAITDNPGPTAVTSCLDAGLNPITPPFDLAPGAAASCSFTVQHLGVPGDMFSDIVTVGAIDDDGADVGADSMQVTVSITAVAAVPLTIVKSATTMSLPEPGGSFDFMVTISNGSPADTATVMSITDNPGATAVTSCVDAGMSPLALPFALAPTEVAACTFSVQHNGNAGEMFTDSVTVVAMDDDNDNVGGTSNMQTVSITDVAAVPLGIGMVANPTSLPQPGGDFDYTVTISNLSSVDTASVSAIVDNPGALAVTNCQDAAMNPISPTFMLAPTEIATCTFTVNHPGVDGQMFTDTVTVTATDDDGANVGGSQMVTVMITAPVPFVDGGTPDFVRFDRDQIRWATVTNAVRYHLYRGDLDVLRSSGLWTQAPGSVEGADRFCDLALAQRDDDYMPGPDKTVFYLVTADDGAGEGGLGQLSSGETRPNDYPCN